MPHYFILFTFQFSDMEIPMIYYIVAKDAEHALYQDADKIQATFEQLQTACQKKINFTISIRTSYMLTEADFSKPILLTNSVEQILTKIEQELGTQNHSTLPFPSIALPENHLTCNLYGNGELVYNVVKNENVMSNFIYNNTWRFGRIMYLDGIRIHNGYIKESALSFYDDLAEKFYTETAKTINMWQPTLPYR